MAKGPDSYSNNILGLLLRWRENPVAIVADIKKGVFNGPATIFINQKRICKTKFQDQIERIMMEKGRGVEKSYIPSRNEREVNEFKKLNREKSFDEARTAVQSQIEKIFQKVSSE